MSNYASTSRMNGAGNTRGRARRVLPSAYDMFPQNEFDTWIGGIKDKIRSGLRYQPSLSGVFGTRAGSRRFGSGFAEGSGDRAGVQSLDHPEREGAVEEGEARGSSVDDDIPVREDELSDEILVEKSVSVGIEEESSVHSSPPTHRVRFTEDTFMQDEDDEDGIPPPQDSQFQAPDSTEMFSIDSLRMYKPKARSGSMSPIRARSPPRSVTPPLRRPSPPARPEAIMSLKPAWQTSMEFRPDLREQGVVLGDRNDHDRGRGHDDGGENGREGQRGARVGRERSPQERDWAGLFTPEEGEPVEPINPSDAAAAPPPEVPMYLSDDVDEFEAWLEGEKEYGEEAQVEEGGNHDLDARSDALEPSRLPEASMSIPEVEVIDVDVDLEADEADDDRQSHNEHDPPHEEDEADELEVNRSRSLSLVPGFAPAERSASPLALSRVMPSEAGAIPSSYSGSSLHPSHAQYLTLPESQVLEVENPPLMPISEEEGPAIPYQSQEPIRPELSEAVSQAEVQTHDDEFTATHLSNPLSEKEVIPLEEFPEPVQAHVDSDIQDLDRTHMEADKAAQTIDLVEEPQIGLEEEEEENGPRPASSHTDLPRSSEEPAEDDVERKEEAEDEHEDAFSDSSQPFYFDGHDWRLKPAYENLTDPEDEDQDEHGSEGDVVESGEEEAVEEEEEVLEDEPATLTLRSSPVWGEEYPEEEEEDELDELEEEAGPSMTYGLVHQSSPPQGATTEDSDDEIEITGHIPAPMQPSHVQPQLLRATGDDGEEEEEEEEEEADDDGEEEDYYGEGEEEEEEETPQDVRSPLDEIMFEPHPSMSPPGEHPEIWEGAVNDVAKNHEELEEDVGLHSAAPILSSLPISDSPPTPRASSLPLDLAPDPGVFDERIEWHATSPSQIHQSTEDDGANIMNEYHVHEVPASPTTEMDSGLDFATTSDPTVEQIQEDDTLQEPADIFEKTDAIPVDPEMLEPADQTLPDIEIEEASFEVEPNQIQDLPSSVWPPNSMVEEITEISPQSSVLPLGGSSLISDTLSALPQNLPPEEISMPPASPAHLSITIHDSRMTSPSASSIPPFSAHPAPVSDMEFGEDLVSHSPPLPTLSPVEPHTERETDATLVDAEACALTQDRDPDLTQSTPLHVDDVTVLDIDDIGPDADNDDIVLGVLDMDGEEGENPDVVEEEVMPPVLDIQDQDETDLFQDVIQPEAIIEPESDLETNVEVDAYPVQSTNLDMESLPHSQSQAEADVQLSAGPVSEDPLVYDGDTDESMFPAPEQPPPLVPADHASPPDDLIHGLQKDPVTEVIAAENDGYSLPVVDAEEVLEEITGPMEMNAPISPVDIAEDLDSLNDLHIPNLSDGVDLNASSVGADAPGAPLPSHVHDLDDKQYTPSSSPSPRVEASSITPTNEATIPTEVPTPHATHSDWTHPPAFSIAEKDVADTSSTVAIHPDDECEEKAEQIKVTAPDNFDEDAGREPFDVPQSYPKPHEDLDRIQEIVEDAKSIEDADGAQQVSDTASPTFLPDLIQDDPKTLAQHSREAEELEFRTETSHIPVVSPPLPQSIAPHSPPTQPAELPYSLPTSRATSQDAHDVVDDNNLPLPLDDHHAQEGPPLLPTTIPSHSWAAFDPPYIMDYSAPFTLSHHKPLHTVHSHPSDEEKSPTDNHPLPTAVEPSPISESHIPEEYLAFSELYQRHTEDEPEPMKDTRFTDVEFADEEYLQYPDESPPAPRGTVFPEDQTHSFLTSDLDAEGEIDEDFILISAPAIVEPQDNIKSNGQNTGKLADHHTEDPDPLKRPINPLHTISPNQESIPDKELPVSLPDVDLKISDVDVSYLPSPESQEHNDGPRVLDNDLKSLGNTDVERIRQPAAVNKESSTDRESISVLKSGAQVQEQTVRSSETPSPSLEEKDFFEVLEAFVSQLSDQKVSLDSTDSHVAGDQAVAPPPSNTVQMVSRSPSITGRQSTTGKSDSPRKSSILSPLRIMFDDTKRKPSNQPVRPLDLKASEASSSHSSSRTIRTFPGSPVDSKFRDSVPLNRSAVHIPGIHPLPPETRDAILAPYLKVEEEASEKTPRKSVTLIPDSQLSPSRQMAESSPLPRTSSLENTGSSVASSSRRVTLQVTPPPQSQNELGIKRLPPIKIPPLQNRHHHHNHQHRKHSPLSLQPRRISSSRSLNSAGNTPPMTRSNCRFHKVAIPIPDTSENKGLFAHFIIPACALVVPELMKVEGMLDCGPATDAENENKTLDLSNVQSELIGLVRQLVGNDMLRESGDVGLLLDDVADKVLIHPNRHLPRHLRSGSDHSWTASSPSSSSLMKTDATPLRTYKSSTALKRRHTAGEQRTHDELMSDDEDGAPRSKRIRSSALAGTPLRSSHSLYHQSLTKAPTLRLSPSVTSESSRTTSSWTASTPTTPTTGVPERRRSQRKLAEEARASAPPEPEPGSGPNEMASKKRKRAKSSKFRYYLVGNATDKRWLPAKEVEVKGSTRKKAKREADREVEDNIIVQNMEY